jgi:hypothetical protein
VEEMTTRKTKKTAKERGREAARALTKELRAADLLKFSCPNCGMRGTLWVEQPQSLMDRMNKVPTQGYWTCPRTEEYA